MFHCFEYVCTHLAKENFENLVFLKLKKQKQKQTDTEAPNSWREKIQEKKFYQGLPQVDVNLIYFVNLWSVANKHYNYPSCNTVLLVFLKQKMSGF